MVIWELIIILYYLSTSIQFKFKNLLHDLDIHVRQRCMDKKNIWNMLKTMNPSNMHHADFYTLMFLLRNLWAFYIIHSCLL